MMTKSELRKYLKSHVLGCGFSWDSPKPEKVLKSKTFSKIVRDASNGVISVSLAVREVIDLCKQPLEFIW